MSFLLKPFCAVGALVSVLSAGPALAQSQADQLAVVYQSGRNQLGILTYCNEKGHIGADVVEIQKKMLGLIPAPADKSGGDAAEAQGKKGTIAMMGVTQDIEAIAKAQNASAATYCKQIGDVVKQAGAALPK
ncbi:pore-forming ESAT-6 family protein [Bosea sp. 2YAB26]|uniref:pore-forming ESAT-6 family protein n=1 Tax=unclassified Bosea (in: a-proteobacteria) TaxID=2653178 RepID=UPI003F8E730A